MRVSCSCLRHRLFLNRRRVALSLRLGDHRRRFACPRAYSINSCVSPPHSRLTPAASALHLSQVGSLTVNPWRRCPVVNARRLMPLDATDGQRTTGGSAREALHRRAGSHHLQAVHRARFEPLDGKAHPHLLGPLPVSARAGLLLVLALRGAISSALRFLDLRLLAVSERRAADFSLSPLSLLFALPSLVRD